MSHKADCPFCKAFAVEVPGPSKEWLWQLPNDSPKVQLEAENEALRDGVFDIYMKLHGEELRTTGAKLNRLLTGVEDEAD